MTKDDPTHTIDCHKCKHYYVTWDKGFPHACRAMSFKSFEYPSFVVYKSSGMKCQAFSPRTQRSRE